MMFFQVSSICVFLFMCANAQKFQRNYERGFSDQYKSETTLGQYAFGYNEDHTSGGSFRRETGDRFGNKIGSYGLRIADGRMRIVNYVADHNGYRADVMTNEPGISNTNSNGYFEITKKGFRGAIIPGFRNSAETPHVVFTNGNPEEFHDGNEQADASSKIVAGIVIDGKSNELRSDYNENVVGDFSNREGISHPHFTISKSIEGVATPNNDGRTNRPRSVYSKSIAESQADIPHSNIREDHLAYNGGIVKESLDSSKSGSIESNQYPRKETSSTYSDNNIGESIPSQNGLKEHSWQGSNQGPDLVDEDHHSQAVDINGAKDSLSVNAFKDLKYNGHGESDSDSQGNTLEVPDLRTESTVTEPTFPAIS
ncbi:hypothetical protein JTE90_008034 [Oedothorax gibbosus]|uniref:Cuticle protein 14 n=1 Tax=Oedothorax gibbosus TaxID=931172 RepID=A0AAV6UXV3_9ARAC|nr:hypothetical protein JTE90_008034 [Oedothorax gibbosus]